MNTGGWLLLTVIFSILILIVQRSERKRRVPTLIIMAIVGSIVGRYAVYRIESECRLLFPIVCQAGWVPQAVVNAANTTLITTALAALVFNALFWVLIGRSNPPGSSDSIQVFGMDD